MKSGMSRRKFLQYAALGALGTVLGCAPAPTAAPSAPTKAPAAVTAAPTAVPTAAVKKGGTYVIFGPQDIPALEPPGAWCCEDWYACGLLIYSPLYNYDKNNKLYPDLAADMPKVSSDGLVYTIPLRKGVKFHNGRQCVADDVKFSFDRCHWPETSNWAKTMLLNVVGAQEVVDGKSQEVSGIKVLDDFTVQFTLKKPQATFVPLLTVAAFAIVPHKECLDAGKDWGQKVVIGTGPFKFVKWETGIKFVLARNPDYFVPGVPHLDGVEIHLKVNQTTALLRYEQGEGELTRIPNAELERVTKDPKLSKAIRRAVPPWLERLCIRSDKPPFDNVLVRQAMAHAIDRDAFVKRYGLEGVKVEGLWSPAMPQFNSAFKNKYAYDPEKAKALLAQAGFGSGIKGVKAAMSGPDGEAMQADLKAVGIEVTLMTAKEAGYKDMIASGEIPLVQGSWTASMPDAYEFVANWITCDSAKTEGTYNFGRYCNEKVDQLFDQAERLPVDSKERFAKYHEIEEIVVNQDVSMLPLYGKAILALGRDYVHDDDLSAIYYNPFLANTWMDKK